MNVRDSVARAQKDILGKVIERELQVARLYDGFSESFPELSELWSSLAKEERGHASILKKMETYIDDGHFLWNLGRLREEVFQDEDQLVLDIQRDFDQGKLNPSNALMAAVRIENSLLDSKFYDVVSCDLPEFKETAERLRYSEEQHMNRLKTEIITFTSSH